MDIDSREVQREKDKARQIRKSAWWLEKLQAKPVCAYCQIALAADEVTMDHIHPLSRGGRSEKSNLAMACKPCNTTKNSMGVVDWYLRQEKRSAGETP